MNSDACMHSTLVLDAAIAYVTRLGNDELIETTQRLLREERELTARLLAHLAEVDSRQLYRQRAYSSMFDCCVQALHLSESEAYLRIGAARLGRRFPRVLPMLAAGELHLTALKLLAPVLDEANCDELLDGARFKRKHEIELLLARRRELPDVPSVIRRLPSPASVSITSATLSQTVQGELLTATASMPPQPAVSPKPAKLEHQPTGLPPRRRLRQLSLRREYDQTNWDRDGLGNACDTTPPRALRSCGPALADRQARRTR